MDKNYKELVEEKVNSSKISDDKKQKVKDFIYTIIDKKTEFIVNGKNEIEKVIAWFSDLTSNPTSTKILFEIIGDKVPKTHKAVDEYLRNYIGLDYKEKDWLTKGEATKILNDNIGKYVFISDSKRDWQKGIKSYPSKPKDLRFLVKVNSNYVVFKYENDINTYELNIDNIRDIVIDGKSSINDSKLEEIVAPLFKNEYIIPMEEKLNLTREDVIEKLKLPKEEKREWFDSLDLTNYEFAIKVMREESLKQTEKKEELTEMNFAQQVYYSNKEKYKKFKDLEWFNLKPNQILVALISDDNKIIYEKIQNEVKSISNLYDKIFEKPDVREKAGNKVSYFVVKFKDLTDNINISYGVIRDFFRIKGLDDDLRDYFEEKKEKNKNELEEKYPEDSRLKIGDKYYLYLKTRGNKDDSNSYILFEYKGITYNANKYAYGSETIYNFTTEYTSNSVKYEELDKLFQNEEILTIDDFNKKFKGKEIVEKFNDDLEYLNNILSASQDLLDLISDTGEKEDIDFLKEKIMVTKDLISILDNNYAKGGEISTSSPYAIEKVNNWNQIPSTWKNTKFINKVNYQIDPFDDKFNSVFKSFLGEDELRPIFSGYNVDDYGVTVTDAHRLAHIPAKLENKGIFNPTTKKLIDGKYANYENIIPTEFSSINEIDTYKLLQYCRVAVNYANKVTYQGLLKYKPTNDKYQIIGFRMNLLISVLESALKNGFQKIYFHIGSKNKFAIISNVKNPTLGENLFFLLSPLMLRDEEKVNNVGAMDIDYGLELSCIFDLSKNEIVNKDDSIVDFKMDYGINPIFTDEVIEIIKTSLQKNPTLGILENFKVKNGSAFLMNLKNEDYSVTIPNINVPDSLYYIKDGVAVKNDNADFDDYVKDIDFSVLNKNNSIKINKDYFSYIINTAKLYVGNDELRPTMMGINFNYDGKDLYVASTNANYLSRLKVDTDIEYENQNNFDIILPVNNLVALLESNEDEYITLDIYSSNSDKTYTPNNIVLKSSSFILRQRLIDGRYPRVNQVIPINTIYEINLNKKEILNAIKSKDVESFIKRNKKLTIVISAKKDNEKLSIILYSTSDARDEFKRIEEIEILNTDLYLRNEEIPTTDSCLLLMPMISKEEPIFSFDFKLFKEFISPVNTDNFKISYTEKTRAYIINEEFFKYEQKFKKTKKAEKIIAPKIISKIEKKQEIKEVEKEENDLEYLNNLLSVSQDLLDLISDSGEKEDIDFLKEKIEVTKDLITLLGDNYANGGGVSYPDLSKQTAQVVNDSVVLDEFSIKKNKNNFTINGFNKKIMSSNDAVKILREIWEDDTINAYEQAYILYFNKANSLIGYYHHSNGGIDGTVMDIQMISGLAVKSLAKGVIIAHNHPSENTQPSNADKQVSEQLKTALKTFNITLLDSLIITNDSYFSFADEGIL